MTIPLTVALLTYNRAHYLRESLHAILGQTWGDFELLVLDNGSTDETPDVVLGARDKRLRYVRNPPGFTANFNGISAKWIARGDRILITHDDDIMEADMLERQMGLIARYPELTAVWTNQSIIDGQGRLLQAHLSPPGDDYIYQRGEYIARTAEERLWHPPSSLVFSHRLLSQFHLGRQYQGAPRIRSRQSIDGSSDQILPAVMNLHGPVAFINAPLLRYRQHAAQETHHVHLAHAALHSFTTLRRLVRKTRYRDEYEPVFDAQIARFKAQDLVLGVASPTLPPALARRLEGLHGRGGGAASARAGYQLLPLSLLITQTRPGSAVLRQLAALPVPPTGSTRAIRALHGWARRRLEGRNLFSHLAPGSRIAIVGSVLVSALLVHEAREAGVEVACCLDSNITRQGRTWLGMQIRPHAWLAGRDERIDAIVLSSERDHEDELEELLRQHDPATPIVSWKDLVDAPAGAPRPARDEPALEAADA